MAGAGALAAQGGVSLSVALCTFCCPSKMPSLASSEVLHCSRAGLTGKLAGASRWRRCSSTRAG